VSEECPRLQPRAVPGGTSLTWFAARFQFDAINLPAEAIKWLIAAGFIPLANNGEEAKPGNRVLTISIRINQTGVKVMRRRPQM
jgi:hypothetical protein